jgi:hypothetical protein
MQPIPFGENGQYLVLKVDRGFPHHRPHARNVASFHQLDELLHQDIYSGLEIMISSKQMAPYHGSLQGESQLFNAFAVDPNARVSEVELCVFLSFFFSSGVVENIA